MNDEPLTASQQDFINVLRTPYRDGGMRLLSIVRAIECVDRSEQIQLVELFLLAYPMYDREEPLSYEVPAYTVEQIESARDELRDCIGDNVVEFCRPFIEDAPLREAAERIVRQLEFLRPKGEMVQAWLLNDIGKSGYLPYLPSYELPLPDPMTSDDVWKHMAVRPRLFALVFRVTKKFCDDPLHLSSCLRQLLKGESAGLREAVVAWALQVAPDMAADERRALRLHLRAARSQKSEATDKAAHVALNTDFSDKTKLN